MPTSTPTEAGIAPSPPSQAQSLLTSRTIPTDDQAWRTLLETDADGLVNWLQSDKKLAATMAEHIADASGDPELRQMMAMTLMQVDPSLIERSAQKLLSDPDASARQKAFEWLKSIPIPLEAVSTTARQVIMTDGNPQVLASALGALRNSGSLLSLQVDDGLTQQLHQYAQSPDPALRSESIITLIHADRTDAVEPVLQRGLQDRDPSVQLAAIEATVTAGIRSPAAKAQLMTLCLDAHTDPQVRMDALEALQSFRLTRDEVGKLAPLQKDEPASP